MSKEQIIEFNKKLGLKTEFIIDEEIEGYSIGNTIYINENSNDYEKVNKHELLHFYEDTEIFQEIKKKIIENNKELIEKVRKEYELRYYGMYSKEEIDSGIIDTEIVIDMITDNFIFEYKEGLKVGEYVLGKIQKELEEKRYLTIKVKNNIENMNISKWEKIFIMNYYDGKKHVMPQGQNKIEKIREDIKRELEELYNKKQEDFIIDYRSSEVLREYESEIKALEQRGEDTSYIESNKEYALKKLAEKFSNNLYEEYKHIVDSIRNENYEDAFKVLMLKETLEKTYKIDIKENKKETIVKKRDLSKSIQGHMVLNKVVLDTIYNNIDDYENFTNLYFAGLSLYNGITAEKSSVTIENVNTYGMGKWIKFEGKASNEKEYIENAKKLSSLVKDTPWCTKTLASTQLEQGDFYVFVDNNNKPHIAVKLNGNEIGELRGIENGNAQDLEEDYRKVALSFLENNKEIKYAKEWMRKEEWNKRLIEHRKKIEEGTFKFEDVPTLLEDLYGNNEYKAHFIENVNKTKLKDKIPEIKPQLSKYYNCKEKEIFTESIDFSKTKYTTVSYKIIFGDVYFSNSKITDLGNLQNIVESTDFSNSKISSLGKLQSIGGDVTFECSQITSLGNLQSIGGTADFKKSKITDLGNLRTIGGYAVFRNSKITSLGNLESIGSDADFRSSKISSLGNLQTIGGSTAFNDSQITDLGKLQSIGGYAVFENSQITDLGNLQTIGGYAVFSDSKITSLGNLQSLGGGANFRYSQITDLGNLQNIGGNADFRDSKITSLGNLQSIGDGANFRNSKISSLGKLQSIGGYAFFENSQITDLGNLQSIGGNAYFENSKVRSLGNLQSIGGTADFSNSQITSLGSLQSIGGDVFIDKSQVYLFENKNIVIGGKFVVDEFEYDSLEDYKEKNKIEVAKKK